MSDPVDSARDESDFRDRSTGLLWFGVLIIGCGCLCTLMLALIWVGQLILSVQTGQAPAVHSLIPAFVFYGGAAAALIALGIGSIQGRRWARPLILIFT